MAKRSAKRPPKRQAHTQSATQEMPPRTQRIVSAIMPSFLSGQTARTESYCVSGLSQDRADRLEAFSEEIGFRESSAAFSKKLLENDEGNKDMQEKLYKRGGKKLQIEEEEYVEGEEEKRERNKLLMHLLARVALLFPTIVPFLAMLSCSKRWLQESDYIVISDLVQCIRLQQNCFIVERVHN